MVEAGAAIGAGLAVLGGRELLVKLLGPTADYLGTELRRFTERMDNNLRRVFVRAGEMAGPALNEPGQVPPRVLKEILQAAPFADDELTSEYFAGVLAASRSKEEQDDRGAVFVNLLSQLSTYDIRTHYLFYTALRRCYQAEFVNIGQERVRHEYRIWLSSESFRDFMQLVDSPDVESVIAETMYRLMALDLITGEWAYGNQESLNAHFPAAGVAPGHGFVVGPNVLGASLFLWANGARTSALRLFDPSLTLSSRVPVKHLDCIPLQAGLRSVG